MVKQVEFEMEDKLADAGLDVRMRHAGGEGHRAVRQSEDLPDF